MIAIRLSGLSRSFGHSCQKISQHHQIERHPDERQCSRRLQAVSAVALIVQAGVMVVLTCAMLHGDVEIFVRGEIDAAVYGDVTTTVE